MYHFVRHKRGNNHRGIAQSESDQFVDARARAIARRRLPRYRLDPSHVESCHVNERHQPIMSPFPCLSPIKIDKSCNWVGVQRNNHLILYLIVKSLQILQLKDYVILYIPR